MPIEEIITKDEGIRFVELCGDRNSIHTEGDIVQGMLLASLAVKSFSQDAIKRYDMNLKRIDMRFYSFVRYNEPLFFGVDKNELVGESEIKISGFGKKLSGENFLVVKEAVYSKQLDEKISEGISYNFIHKRSIPIEADKIYCNSLLKIDKDILEFPAIREFFFTIFISGALFDYIGPKYDNQLSENKIVPVWGRQEYNFYKLPPNKIYDMSILLKTVRDSENWIAVREYCCVNGSEITDGNSLLLKKKESEVVNYKNAA